MFFLQVTGLLLPNQTFATMIFWQVIHSLVSTLGRSWFPWKCPYT